MTYYIVMNEWNYPTESGREFVGDFDSRLDAEAAIVEEYFNEKKNFLKVMKEEICSIASGPRYDWGTLTGYILTTSPNETEGFFFRSVIIEREV